MDMQQKLQKVNEKRSVLEQGGGVKEIEKQHSMTKLTAWERMELLFDPGTFQELNIWSTPLMTGFDIDERPLPRDAVVIGYGEIHGRPVLCYGHDFTTLAGTQAVVQNSKVAKIMQRAVVEGIPFVGMADSGGVRIHDMFGRSGFKPIIRGCTIAEAGHLMYSPPIASGVVPQISLMIGPCYAGSAYSPIMADFVIMCKGTSYMSVASPPLLKAVTFADVTQEEIGGAWLHATTTGSCDFFVESDEEAIAKCRELLSFLPSNWKEKPPWVDTGDDPNRREEKLLHIVPLDAFLPYDVHDVISQVVDNGNFFELQSLFAPNMVIGLARLAGQVVGIVANNPAVTAGSLDVNTSDKEARFIRCCDAFNIPLIFLVDTPGFLPSKQQEQSREGLERHAAKPVFAICESTVPKIVVYLRKCYGAGRLVMGTERLGVDAVYAWPSAELRAVDLKAAVEEIYYQKLAKAENPEQLLADKVKEFSEKFDEPDLSGAIQTIEDIIDPRETRPLLVKTLNRLSGKLEPARPWRKHSLVPL